MPVQQKVVVKKTWMPIAAAAMLLLAIIPYVVLCVHTDLFLWLPYLLPLLAGGVFALTRKAWWLAFLGAISPVVLTVLMSPYAPMGVSLSISLFFFTTLSWPDCQLIEFVGYLFMVCSAVLLVWAKGEFPGKSAAEHLYGPPKWWRETRA